jgi:hypothetical protein
MTVNVVPARQIALEDRNWSRDVMQLLNHIHYQYHSATYCSNSRFGLTSNTGKAYKYQFAKTVKKKSGIAEC